MKQDTYEVVCWPEIQFLFGEEGFEQNAYLINDEKGIDDFGSSARIKDIGNNKLEVSVTASPHAMEYWAMQYLNYVEIKTPVALRERIKENIKNAKERYS